MFFRKSILFSKLRNNFLIGTYSMPLDIHFSQLIETLLFVPFYKIIENNNTENNKIKLIMNYMSSKKQLLRVDKFTKRKNLKYSP